jgi:hypothetical protein
MIRCRPLLAALLVLPLSLLSVPAHAQDADTTGADTTAVDASTTDTSATDTSATDTNQMVPSDTAVADTPQADTSARDTSATDAPNVAPAQVPATPDTLTTDTTAEANTRAVDEAPTTAAQRERAKKRARVAAEAWLSRIDAGQFGAGWDEAAPALQQSTPRETWRKRGAQARSRLQSPTSRELTRAVYRDSTLQLPGSAPVVALQYSTEFEGGQALEAVIIAKQGDNWKVAGYRVVPASADSAQAADSTQVPANADQAPADADQPPDSMQAQPAPDTTQSAPEPDSMQAQPVPDTSQNTSGPDSTQGQ